MARTRRKAKSSARPTQVDAPTLLDQQMRSALAYATPTSSVVQWNALRQWLRTAPPALSERARCELLLDAANGIAMQASAWRQLIGGNVHAFGVDRVPLPERERQSLRAALEMIATDYKAALRTLKPQVDEAALSSVVLTIDGRILATAMPGAIAYGIWRFLDREDLGRALCHCRYRNCGKFFFEYRANGTRGRPQRLYCLREHGELEDTAAAALRMARRRKEKKA